MSQVSLLLALCLIGVGCSSETAPTPTTLPEPVGPGRLALLDGEGNVVVVDGEGNDPVEVAAAGEEVAYGQPIWSPDGSVVSYARASADGFAYVLSEVDAGSTTEVTLDNYPFYAFWSPDGVTVGILRNGASSVVFELIDVSEATVETVADDTPFYFSWSPSGGEVAAHAGAERLLRLGPVAPESEPRLTDAGYLAPQWLDAGLLHVVGSELVLERVDGSRSAIVDVEGVTIFVADPTGRRVAVQSLAAGSGVSVALREAASVEPNSVAVVEIASGDSVTVRATPAAGFFWSPDGERLLLLGPDETRERLDISVWSDQGIDEYGTYTPSPILVRDLFPFFPQYAQSLSFWAADSSAFAYVGEVDGEEGVWVQRLDSPSPQFVNEGNWAAWSP